MPSWQINMIKCPLGCPDCRHKLFCVCWCLHQTQLVPFWLPSPPRRSTAGQSCLHSNIKVRFVPYVWFNLTAVLLNCGSMALPLLPTVSEVSSSDRCRQMQKRLIFLATFCRGLSGVASAVILVFQNESKCKLAQKICSQIVNKTSEVRCFGIGSCLRHKNCSSFRRKRTCIPSSGRAFVSGFCSYLHSESVVINSAETLFSREITCILLSHE